MKRPVAGESIARFVYEPEEIDPYIDALIAERDRLIEQHRLGAELSKKNIALIKELSLKCDRLRRALMEIENTPPTNIQDQVAMPELWWKRLMVEMLDIARDALAEGGRTDD